MEHLFNQPNDTTLHLLDCLFEFWNLPASPGADPAAASSPIAPELIFAPDYSGFDVTDHSRVDGPAGEAKRRERLRTAFPDVHFEALDLIREGNRVSVYWTANGTHQGKMLNIPPTGRRVTVNGVSMLFIENERIKQSVHLWDLAGLLRAVGLLPELDLRPPLDPFELKDALTVC